MIALDDGRLVASTVAQRKTTAVSQCLRYNANTEPAGVRHPRARHMESRALPEGMQDLTFISSSLHQRNGEDLPMQFKLQFLLPSEGQMNLCKLNLHTILLRRVYAHSNRPTKFPRSEANSTCRPAPLFPRECRSYLGGLVGGLRQELVVV